NISQDGLADYLIRRPDEPQRGLDRYRTGTGRAVDDVRCRHSSHHYSLAPVRTLIHVHSRPWSTLVYHPAGALINGPGRRWRMVASDSFAEFLREELTPLGRITMRRMVSKTGVYCDGLMFGWWRMTRSTFGLMTTAGRRSRKPNPFRPSATRRRAAP